MNLTPYFISLFSRTPPSTRNLFSVESDLRSSCFRLQMSQSVRYVASKREKTNSEQQLGRGSMELAKQHAVRPTASAKMTGQSLLKLSCWEILSKGEFSSGDRTSGFSTPPWAFLFHGINNSNLRWKHFTLGAFSSAQCFNTLSCWLSPFLLVTELESAWPRAWRFEGSPCCSQIPLSKV